MWEDTNKEYLKSIVDVFGYDAIPKTRFMQRVHEVSGLSFSNIGHLMKKYDRRLILAGVMFSKQYNKSEILPYVIAIIEKMKYFEEARKRV